MDSWQKMLQEDEQVMLVNSKDEVVGVTGKIAAHQGHGQLHRAVTVFLMNEKGETLVTQRSARKPLWPLFWDAACSTHQWPGEDDLTCALRRLPFEIGVQTAEDLRFVFRYEYHAVYSPEWAENEVNHILLGTYVGELSPNPNEVAAAEWKALSQIKAELQNTRHHYAPWFLQAFEQLSQYL